MARRTGVAEDLQLIGGRIKRRRREVGLNENQFGSLVGLAEPSVRSMESGESVKGFLKLAEIAVALQTTPSALLGFTDEHVEAGCLASIKAILIDLFGRMKLKPDQSVLLAEAVLNASEARPSKIGGSLDRETAARFRAEVLFDQFDFLK